VSLKKKNSLLRFKKINVVYYCIYECAKRENLKFICIQEERIIFAKKKFKYVFSFYKNYKLSSIVYTKNLFTFNPYLHLIGTILED